MITVVFFHRKNFALNKRRFQNKHGERVSKGFFSPDHIKT